MTRIIAVMLMVTLPLCALAEGAPATAEEPEELGEDVHAVLVRAYWPDQDLSNTFYRIYEDENLRELVDVFPATGRDGTGFVVLPPGTYYVMAVVDIGGTERPEPGDGIGFYGVEEISAAARPQPLEVGEDGMDSIVIPILVRLNQEMRMEPLEWTQAHLRGTVTGTVEGLDGYDAIVAVLPLGDHGQSFAAPVAEDGRFEVEAQPGTCLVVAMVDVDGDGRLSDDDPIGIAGSVDEPIEVAHDEEIDVGTLTLSTDAEVPEDIPAIISGRVTGAETFHEAIISVAIFTDSSMREEVVSLETVHSGRFAAVLEPGAYYLRTIVDRDGDGMIGIGDLLGFYGVTDLLGEETPAPLQVEADTFATDVDIPISGRINEEGMLSAWPGAGPEPNDAPENEADNAPGE